MITKAILKINSSAEFTINENDINQITWLNGTTPISKADIEAKMVELQAEYDANQYQRDRVYPQISEQLDKLFHDIDGGLLGEDAKTGSLYLALKEVKDDNPKPSE